MINNKNNKIIKRSLSTSSLSLQTSNLSLQTSPRVSCYVNDNNSYSSINGK